MGVSIFTIFLINLFLVTSFPDEGDESQRIILGNRVNITEVPWQVSFQSISGPLGFFCNGAIIGPREVITSAHCTDGMNISTILIRAGSTSILEGGSTHRIETAQVHPKYVCTISKPENDFSFVRVKEKFRFSSYIQPIRISTRNPKNGEKVKVIGWGKTNPVYLNPPTDQPKNLRYAMLRAWDKHACYRDFKREDVLKLNEDFYCINNFKFGTKEAPCTGDSGSPVVLNDQLVGIVSSFLLFSYYEEENKKISPDTPCHLADPKIQLSIQKRLVCNDPKTIAVYDSVVDHRKWIDEMLKKS